MTDFSTYTVDEVRGVYDADDNFKGLMGTGKKTGKILKLDGLASSGKRVVACFGNSLQVGGAVTPGGLENSTSQHTPWDLMGYLNAGLGRAWTRVMQHGENGASSLRIAQIMEAVLRERWDEVDDIIVYGVHHNDAAMGVSMEQAKKAVADMCSMTSGKRLFLLTDPMADAAQTGDGRTRYAAALENVRDMARRHGHVFVVPIHEAYNSKSGGTLVSLGLAQDTVHPSAVGVVEAILPVAVESMGRMCTPVGLPVTGEEDARCITANPFVSGNNASGVNRWFAQNGATGNGPGGYYGRIISGAGAVMTSSKVEHPKIKGWSNGTVPCWKVSMSTAAAAAEFELSTIDSEVYAWSSGAAVVSPTQVIKPTTQNERLYRVIAGGALANGADPTASWPTVLGQEFAAGTATLRCIQDHRGKKAVGFCDMYPDQATMAGEFNFQMWAKLRSFAAPFTYVGGSVGFNVGLPIDIGSGHYGIKGGHAWLPSRLTVCTQVDRAVNVSQEAEIAGATLTFKLAPNSRIDIIIAAMGVAVAE